ncbi:MAG: trypsin-like peptidase domain-containing protein, partial [Candidatus Magasanikbacteria bacterium]|nr:trypsin-like peptidase domain-containing protein [Candidatus Magasanikbacteria bacterium]
NIPVPESKKKAHVRKVKDPEAIYEEAGYLVKLRIFKKTIIPVTGQVIYQDTNSFGSGFITDDKALCKKSKYCVVTAFHVVDDSSMTFFAEAKDGSKAQLLELTHGTTNYDFAVLRFVDFRHIPKKVAVIGRSSTLKPGTRIHAMGSNRYGDFWFSPSGHLFTNVKAANADLKKKLEGSGLDHPELLLFHTPVFRGFSGGPLVNKYGEVVAITVGFTGLDAEPIYIGSPIDGIKKTLRKMK